MPKLSEEVSGRESQDKQRDKILLFLEPSNNFQYILCSSESLKT